MRIAIVGAGYIGLYVGARLIEAGASVVFVGRERMKRHVETYGLSVSSYLKQSYRVPDSQLDYQTDFARMGQVDYVLITVKTTDTDEVLLALTPYLAPETQIINLQNGVDNKEMFERHGLSDRLVEGMVTFNVVMNDQSELYQAVSGPVVIDEKMGPDLRELFKQARFEFLASENIQGHKWSKLLLNLNNSLNAISGLPIKQELEDIYYRRILAAMMRETLKIIKERDIKLERLTPVPPHFLPWILELPNFLFKRLARRMIDIDPKARSSMLVDLERGSTTEIDYLNGKIISHGFNLQISVPFNEKVFWLIREAETRQSGPPRVRGIDLWKMVNPPFPTR